MARKKTKSLFSLKTSSITALIAILLITLVKLGESVVQDPYPAAELPSSSEPVQLYSNQTGDNLTQLYVNAIRSAEHSITLVIFSLKDPQIIQALKDRCQSGISVYIVCDAQASKGITKQCNGSGIKIIRRAGKGLTHQKIVIIDSEQILIGSANFTTESLITHGNLVMGLKNHVLANTLEDKIKSMDEDGDSTPLLHKDVIIGNQKVELWILPDDPQAVNRLKTLIRSAKKTVNIAMFTWTRRDLTQDLIEASQRNVKVDTIIDNYSGKGASAKIVNMLSTGGIPIALSTGKGLMHHKFAYIDGKTLINGSANWTHNAFANNDDCFIVLSPLTKDQRNKMNALWKCLQRESEQVREK